MTDIDALLRRAEMQKTQMELNLRFQKNLELFNKFMPSVFKAYENYNPEELRLSFEDDGNINLVNYQLNNKPIYGENPKEFAHKQVDHFIANPMVSSIDFVESRLLNPRHFHAKIINEVIEKNNDFETDFDNLESIPIGLMLMTGCGLGYQIQELIDKLDIYNLYIVDPHKDSFYAALHTIDWEPILNHFRKPHRNLIICTGQNPDTTMQTIKMALGQAGLHCGIYTFIYRHFNSKEERQFIELYKKKFHLSAFGLGFAEDEQISFAHTTANINKKIPILNNLAVEKKNPPAFIIGNGPSLDTLKDFIIENKDNAVIFSGGTTASSLSQMGINTDFHIEMERSLTTQFWLKSGTDEAFRDHAILLGLNTVHPDTFKLFKRRYMAIKANDLGEVLINNENKNKNDTFPPLNYCNPTVTNCAVSYAISLGFTEIYLLGVDLGMVDPNKHHSENSIHHKIKHNPDKDRYTYKKGQYKVKGNFVEEVFTENLLDSSRISFVELLKTQKNIRVYNPNNGAYIDGATPTKLPDLPRPVKLENKRDFIDAILDRKFTRLSANALTKNYVRKEYINSLSILKHVLDTPAEINSKTDLMDSMNLIYKTLDLSEKQIPIGKMLLRGSINSYFGLMSKYCMATKDDSSLKKNYEIVHSGYREFLENAFTMMEKEPLRLDDTTPTIRF